MSQALSGRTTRFNLATTCTLLTGLPASPANAGITLRIESTVDVYVVQDGGVTADGGALPANYIRIPAGVVDYLPIGSDAILLAGASVAAVGVTICAKDF